MSAMASQITGVSIVYSTVCLGVDQRKYQSSFECYFDVCFLSCEATRQLNTKTTLKYTYKPFAKTVHILFYFLHDTMNPNMTIKKQSSNMGSVPNSLSSRSANNATIDYWWRHKYIFHLIVTPVHEKPRTRQMSISFTTGRDLLAVGTEYGRNAASFTIINDVSR